MRKSSSLVDCFQKVYENFDELCVHDLPKQPREVTSKGTKCLMVSFKQVDQCGAQEVTHSFSPKSSISKYSIS